MFFDRFRRDIDNITAAAVKFVHFALDGIYANHFETGIREDDGERQADIAQAKDPDHRGSIREFLESSFFCVHQIPLP